MHLQNLPINRCNPSLETTTSQVITYPHLRSSYQNICQLLHFSSNPRFTPIYSHIPIQPCIKNARFADTLRCLRASSTHPHFAFAQKIGRVTKSVTLPYTFHFLIFLNYIFLSFGQEAPCKLFLLDFQSRSIPRLWPGQFYTSEVFNSLFVVWFSRIYPIRSVYLLQQNHPHKLVRKCHF